MRTVVLFLVALLFCSFVAGCDSMGASGRGDQLSSKYVSASDGGLMGGFDSGFMLFLSVKNKSKQPVWVKVSFEAPDAAQRGEASEALGMGAVHMFTHPQSSITYDTDYPVHVSTYGDAAYTQLLERTDTKFRFSAAEAHAFEEASKEAQAKSKKN